MSCYKKCEISDSFLLLLFLLMLPGCRNGKPGPEGTERRVKPSIWRDESLIWPYSFPTILIFTESEGISPIGTYHPPAKFPVRGLSTPLIFRAGLWHRRDANSNETFPDGTLQSIDHTGCCLTSLFLCHTASYAAGTSNVFFFLNFIQQL